MQCPVDQSHHGLYMWGRFLKINGDKVVLSGSMINGEFVPVIVSSIAAFKLGEMHRFENYLGSQSDHVDHRVPAGKRGRRTHYSRGSG